MPRSYTREFKQEAVNLVFQEGDSVRNAARRLGIPAKTLEGWVRKYRSEDGSRPQVAAQEELEQENRRLRQENRRLRMEREVLKKATAYFAKESQ